MKIKKTKVYKGKNINVTFYESKIKNKIIKHEMVEQNNAVAILALDGDDVILVEEFRYPIGYVLEIPAGNIDKNETALACAKRELLEETGYRAKQIKHLTRFYPKLGYNTQMIDCYVATKLQKVASPNLDNDELITVKKIKFQKLLNLIKEGKILTSFTICAALTYELKKRIKNENKL